MSLKTWKRAFYPKDAADTTPAEAVAHSLRKWEGLTAANRRKHGVTVEGVMGELVEADGDPADGLPIDSETCALCVHYYEPSRNILLCRGCPLAIARGGVPCTELGDGEDTSPWGEWVDSRNTGPMLRWLRKARRAELKAKAAEIATQKTAHYRVK